MNALLVGVVAAWCAVGLDAQRVWVVRDSAPVQPVVDLASPGDRIELHGTRHPSFTVDKALDIVGMVPDAGAEGVMVQGLPSGSVLSIRALKLAGSGVFLRGNAGTIVLRRLLCYGFYGTPCSIETCARVHVESCFFFSGSFLGAGPGMFVDRSNLTMIGGRTFGFSGSEWMGPYAGMFMRRSDVLLSDCRVVGADSWRWWDVRCPCWQYTPAASAIEGDDRLVLMDGCEVAGGNRGFVLAHDVPDVRQTPDTVLVGGVRQALVIPPQPTLTVPETVPIGGLIAATAHARPRSAVVVLVDLASPGPTWVDWLPVPLYVSPGAHVAGVRIADAGGVASFSVRVPSDPRLRFSTVFLQAVAGSFAPNELGASAPRSAHLQ